MMKRDEVGLDDEATGLERAVFGNICRERIDAWLVSHVRARLSAEVSAVLFRSGRVGAVYGLPVIVREVSAAPPNWHACISDGTGAQEQAHGRRKVAPEQKPRKYCLEKGRYSVLPPRESVNPTGVSDIAGYDRLVATWRVSPWRFPRLILCPGGFGADRSTSRGTALRGACSTLLTTLSKRDTSNRSEFEPVTDE